MHQSKQNFEISSSDQVKLQIRVGVSDIRFIILLILYECALCNDEDDN